MSALANATELDPSSAHVIHHPLFRKVEDRWESSGDCTSLTTSLGFGFWANYCTSRYSSSKTTRFRFKTQHQRLLFHWQDDNIRPNLVTHVIGASYQSLETGRIQILAVSGNGDHIENGQQIYITQAMVDTASSIELSYLYDVGWPQYDQFKKTGNSFMRRLGGIDATVKGLCSTPCMTIDRRGARGVETGVVLFLDTREVELLLGWREGRRAIQMDGSES
ncbi:hypothetical protein IW261DRAFT_1420040 [Armillaria novae-zelandiae]|uniref:Uncharacterized protein n=1 Tax=Armillaria novae-zelandiae TaxID=153914 RepID=A0AA39P8P5_9AGAR|nr:hypothetical protein IW261DRAFT_1420040 [Armillaria novae-zelandiae]